MRLKELNPEWHEDGRDPEIFWLRFDCPHCRDKDELHIQVKCGPPPGGKHNVWGWNGERDFDKVTIAPSIRFFGHWHGFITNGDVSMLADEPAAPAPPAPPPGGAPGPEVPPAPPAPPPAPAPVSAVTGNATLDEHGLPIVHDNIGHRDLIASLQALTDRVRKLL